MLWGGGEGWHHRRCLATTASDGGIMAYDDMHRSLVAFEQDSTLVAVIEMSQSSWLVAGLVPGLSRDPEKKVEPDPEGLLAVLRRWQSEAERAGAPLGRSGGATGVGRGGLRGGDGE